MLVYFNTMGQIQRQLEYGQLAYLSTTNYTVFAVQEGYEYQEGDMATLSLKRPDGTLLEAEIWGKWTEITFDKNANLTTSLSGEDCLPFVDGETYYGFEFEISDICIFNQTGMYKGTVSINPQNKARRLLSGIIPIYVNETEINVDGFDMTYSEYTVLINKILEQEATLSGLTNGIIKEINTEYTRIWDLDVGIYKLTYSGDKYLYHWGATSAASVNVGKGILLLYVWTNQFYKCWKCITGSSSSFGNTVRFGQTNETSGTSYIRYAISPIESINGLRYNDVIYAPTTAGSSGQVLISNGNANAPTWGDKDVILELNNEDSMTVYNHYSNNTATSSKITLTGSYQIKQYNKVKLTVNADGMSFVFYLGITNLEYVEFSGTPTGIVFECLARYGETLGVKLDYKIASFSIEDGTTTFELHLVDMALKSST